MMLEGRSFEDRMVRWAKQEKKREKKSFQVTSKGRELTARACTNTQKGESTGGTDFVYPSRGVVRLRGRGYSRPTQEGESLRDELSPVLKRARAHDEPDSSTTRRERERNGDEDIPYIPKGLELRGKIFNITPERRDPGGRDSI